jgi:hypothetical protein
MTKSKGIGRGGRRKGAGRPRFTKNGKASNFSTRVTQKTRDLLEAEARLHGESLSEVAEYLLQIGMDERAKRRDRKRGPHRAFGFLLEVLNQEILGPYLRDPKYTWRSNPYMFEAFRTAVVHLLNGLGPPGEVVTPPLAPIPTPNEDNLYNFVFPDAPQDYGRICAQRVFLSMQIYSLRETAFRIPPDAPPNLHSSMMREYYGLIDARQDLSLEGPIRGLKEESK